MSIKANTADRFAPADFFVHKEHEWKHSNGSPNMA